MPYEKVGKNEPVCIADEVPFDIPESWEWVRHNELFEISGGSQPPKSKFVTEPKRGYVRLYQIRDYGNSPVPVYIPINTASKISKKGDILLARYGASLGKVFWAEDGAYNVAMARVVPLYESELIYKKYLFLFYQSNLYQELIHSNSRSAQAGFNKEDLSKLFLPIPPFKEQLRIVSTYENLQPYIADYEIAGNHLRNLNMDFPTNLKKSILQYAIQGKLVPQDPADEPASVLLEHIRAEKEQLIKAGKIKRDKHESVIFRRDNSYYEKVDGIERCIDDEIPFEIPESWGWCRLKSLTENITSGSRDWAKYYSTTGAAFLRMGNLSKNSFDLRLEHIQRVSIPSKAEGTRTSLQRGDLLFSITGDVGMLGLIPDGFEKAYINQHTAMIRFLPEMRNKYIPYLLLTDYAQKFYNANQHGIKNSFRLDSIGELLVSIPPEKELFRILQRISLVLSKIAVL